MKRFRKALVWFITNGAIASMAVGAVFYDVQWASNLVRFLVWFMVITWIITAFTIESLLKKEGAPKFDRSVPQWLSVGIDVVVIIVFAAGGWFLYAALFTLQAYLSEYAHIKVNTYLESQEPMAKAA